MWNHKKVQGFRRMKMSLMRRPVLLNASYEALRIIPVMRR